MKYLTILFLALLFSNNIDAQNVSYWVGQSSNPDPIMRHHEAFMDAFIKYVQNRPKEAAEEVITNYAEEIEASDTISMAQNRDDDTCRLQTVSSVASEGRETITISTGIGPLVHYQCLTEFASTNDKTLTKTILKITYQEELHYVDTESVHEYRMEECTENSNNTTVSQFSYQCTSTSKY